MTQPQPQPEFAVWSADGHSMMVEYSAEAMNQIRMEAVDGFFKLSHGGLEIGGVLFGDHNGHARGAHVRIVAQRPLKCEYRNGPSFVLSEGDFSHLAELLEAAKSDAELAGLEPVGWYHSHTRSGIFLSDLDLAIHDRFFPQPWQIALVVRPEKFEPTRGGFFFREPDGRVRTECSYGEFVLEPIRQAAKPKPVLEPAEPVAARVADQPAEPQKAIEKITPITAGPVMETEPPLPVPSFAPPAPAPRLWLPLAMLTVGMLGAGYLYWRTHPKEPLLRTAESDGRMRIEWDTARDAVRNAQSGALEIVEGDYRVQIFLTGAQMRRGGIGYYRHAEIVNVRLRAENAAGDVVEEYTRFVGPPTSRPFPADPFAKSVLPEADEPAVNEPTVNEAKTSESPSRDNQEELRKEEARRAELRKAEERKAEQSKAELRMLAERPVAPQPVRSFTPPPKGVKEPTTQIAALAPPSADVSASLPAGMPPNLPILNTAPGVPVRIVPPPPPAPKPAEPVRSEPAPRTESPRQPPPYAGPTSGRFLWTGHLAPGNVLTVNGRQASAGSVTGELPGVPVRIAVHPADLAGKAIVVYSGNSRYARGVTEPASARNGWNTTQYKFDPKRAASVVVLETPSAQNGWKGLAIRSESQPVPVIFVEWEVAQN